MTRSKFGAENNAWKGGRTITHYGYVMIRLDEKSVLEHVIVAEKILGIPLPPKARLHHVDGNRVNNSPGNLVICQDQSYHMLLHRRQRALEACGNTNWRPCRICKEYDDPQNMYGLRGEYRHRACHAEAEKLRKTELRVANG